MKKNNYRMVMVLIVIYPVLMVCCNTRQAPDKPESHANNVETLYMDVTGMHCDGCARSIENSVKPLNGIVSCTASFQDKNTSIKYDPKIISKEKILETLSQTGYSFKETEPPPK